MDRVDIVVKALSSPDYRLRREAALALGRIGSHTALAAVLRARLSEPSNSPAVPAMEVAEARLRSQEVAGLRTLDVFAQALGTSLPGLFLMSRRLRDLPRARDLPASREELIVQAASEILVELKASGQHVDAIVDRFAFSRSQALAIRVAGLPPDEQIREMLDYIRTRNAASAEEYTVAQMLLDHGQSGVQAMIAELRRAVDHRDALLGGHQLLIQAVAMSGDKSAVPLLRTLASNEDRYVRHQAQMALQSLESGKLIVALGGPE